MKLLTEKMYKSLREQVNKDLAPMKQVIFEHTLKEQRRIDMAKKGGGKKGGKGGKKGC